MDDSETSMSGGEKSQPQSAEVKQRDCLTGVQNVVQERPQNPNPPQDGGNVDSPKVSGTKRPLASCFPSPAKQKYASNGCKNEHVVYVRRKLETEHGKSNIDRHLPSNESSKPKGADSKQCLESQQEQAQVPRLFPCSASKPISGVSSISSKDQLDLLPSSKPVMDLPKTEPNNPVVTSANPSLVNPPETHNLHWKDRFLRVQAFLKACDNSSQEDYIQMLRSLSPAERSKHAVALEKRAIHLLLEEGKELQLMKVLDIFGKASPVDQSRMPTSNTSNTQVAQVKLENKSK